MWDWRLVLFFLLNLGVINSQTKCGIPNGTFLKQQKNLDQKIVGGVEVGYFKYPWYVALTREGEIYCGSTLIHEKYIVSAAHCYEDFFDQASAGKIKLENVLKPIFGVYNICNTHEPTQQRKKLAKVWIHEKYDKKGDYYDISLLKLKKKVDTNKFMPCCLPTKVYNSNTRPKEGLITGLGDQVFNDRNITCLAKEARILIYSDDVCKKTLTDPGQDPSKTPLIGAFCAGYLEGKVDACQGDSGGPLTILAPDSKYILLGVVSFGEGCAKPGHPGVYTDVSQYLDWIYKKSKIPRPSTTEPTIPTEPDETTSSTKTPKPTKPTTSDGSYSPSTYTFPDVIPTQPYIPDQNQKPPQVIIIVNKKNKNGTKSRHDNKRSNKKEKEKIKKE
ncbi:serine protease 1-like [Onthophagus taurus]|uniref:serine protease 1-like n=1 Tax=Onthophagus taurus TaxID=166361 RepID=UPI0039BE684F